MSISEFSDQFDVLYNNITSNQAPGLNEYEKSVFLTKAQEELVKNYFSPKGNPKQDGFDDSPKRQTDFANIITFSTLPLVSDINTFDKRSGAFMLPADLFICLNEQLSDGNTPITVVPISYDEYDRLMSKPYKFPPKYQAWRLITKNTTVGGSTCTASYDGTKEGINYSLRLVSSYSKPVRMVVMIGTRAVAPVIEETGSAVTITCVVSVASPTSNYWSTYLSNKPNITPYLGDFSGSTGHSSFMSLTATELETIGAGTTLADISTPGTGTRVIPIAEIIGRFTNGVPEYRMRYIRRPNPIILVDLSNISNSLTIQGETGPITSELSEELHEEILQRAVELAKIAWVGDAAATIQTGQRSE